MSNVTYERVNWEDSPSQHTPINQTNLNKMDKGIKDCVDELNSFEEDAAQTHAETLELIGTKNSLKISNDATKEIKFGITADGDYGFIKDGADTVTPFSKGAQLVGNYSANASIDVTNYHPKSADEFFIVPRGNTSTSGSFSTWNYGGTVSVSGSFSLGTKSLNGNTLSVTAPRITASGSLPNIDSWSGTSIVPYSVYFVASI